MMTNTYLPHVGGVARSVHAFEREYRRRGHRTLVVAPTFDHVRVGDGAAGVLRVPSIQRFNGSDFSIPLPGAATADRRLWDFPADVVHSHHPFLMGDAAVRLAAAKGVPIVFTHHTLYEEYTHYVSLDCRAARRFIITLSTHYANLCDAVIAPSRSLAGLLERRGVRSRIEVIATGLGPEAFSRGDGAAFRRSLGIPAKAFVVGHLGRLAPEKNLAFLFRAVARLMAREPRAVFLLVGVGSALEAALSVFREAGLQRRVFMPGEKVGRQLYDAYAAMDVFAFASLTETQGLVLLEAMASGLPVVALDACGVREVIEDGINGFLLGREAGADDFAAVMGRVGRDRALREALRRGARRTARAYTQTRSAEKALTLYDGLRASPFGRGRRKWDRFKRRSRAEWRLAAEKVRSLAGLWPRGR